MFSTEEAGIAACATAGRTGHPHRLRRLAGAGFIAALAAAVTTLAAALVRAAGVDFAVTGGETIPLGGFRG
ncbi:DUF6069 family protein [Streptomonospora nanhaiensis]|uniref:DUF6069 family protein n=1 Tax=Streptomonospora nanhaiensis TaxID=1323731 RepID=UPI001C98ED46|nr:hypothetical protein [Streptomonospora nanhaiensis]MBX9386936.1 hypothetical protein [Streptomonospora nanhaiensis]